MTKLTRDIPTEPKNWHAGTTPADHAPQPTQAIHGMGNGGLDDLWVPLSLEDRCAMWIGAAIFFGAVIGLIAFAIGLSGWGSGA